MGVISGGHMHETIRANAPSQLLLQSCVQRGGGVFSRDYSTIPLLCVDIPCSYTY